MVDLEILRKEGRNSSSMRWGASFVLKRWGPESHGRWLLQGDLLLDDKTQALKARDFLRDSLCLELKSPGYHPCLFVRTARLEEEKGRGHCKLRLEFEVGNRYHIIFDAEPTKEFSFHECSSVSRNGTGWLEVQASTQLMADDFEALLGERSAGNPYVSLFPGWNRKSGKYEWERIPEGGLRFVLKGEHDLV